MSKRSNTIVLSSDEDEEAFITNTKCSSSNSKFNRKYSKSVPNSKSKKNSSTRTTKKKARVSYSLSSSVELLSNFNESKFMSGDLAEDFAGFKVSTDSRRLNGAESWIDKYRPRSLDELAVHKKKVEEVRTWFEDRLNNPKQGSQSYALLITGQAGIGKSATVHVIATYFGVEVCEWNTPTPTIWQEHVHSNSGMRYTSKLDEFENFVERARKYGMLSSSLTGLKQSMVLLIEDFPLTNGRLAQGRLLSSLQLLVKSVQVPTIILITDCSAADSADAGMRHLEELSSALESAGACKIAFNPITVNSIKKVLSRICKQEKCSISGEQLDLIANASGGDIRHAIMTFQYACLRQEKTGLVSHEKCTFDLEAKHDHDHDQKDGGSILAFGRDQILSLFHALGKFLHNKRDAECTMSHREDIFNLKEGFNRLPFKMDAPEKVLCQAYGQARPVAEFLHENVLDFLCQEAIEDAWTVASYLSDADCLLSSAHRMTAKNYEAENIIQSTAASVAVRGVLFGNAHPSPSRWHVIRRPLLWQVDKSTRSNMHGMERRRLDHCFSAGLPNVSAICTDYSPALKWLSRRASLSFEPADVNKIEDDSMGIDELDQMNPQDQACESTDDDIEEW